MYTIVTAYDDEDFGRKAANAFHLSLMGYVFPHVGFPTGNTPIPFYKQLVKDGYSVPYSYGQLDEYLGLSPDHPKSFLNEMRQNLILPLGIRITSSFNSMAANFEPMRRHFDIAVLGMGKNGHVAFNEPGSSFDSLTRIVDLDPQTIADNRKDWDEEKYGPFPTQAVTRGIGELRLAGRTLLFVRGESKAEILYKALREPPTPKVPASYLQHQREVTIVADQAALSVLSRRPS